MTSVDRETTDAVGFNIVSVKSYLFLFIIAWCYSIYSVYCADTVPFPVPIYSQLQLSVYRKQSTKKN